MATERYESKGTPQHRRVADLHVHDVLQVQLVMLQHAHEGVQGLARRLPVLPADVLQARQQGLFVQLQQHMGSSERGGPLSSGKDLLKLAAACCPQSLLGWEEGKGRVNCLLQLAAAAHAAARLGGALIDTWQQPGAAMRE